MDDALLCELVKQNPCLYDNRNKFFKDQNMRDSIWTDIGNRMAQPHEECKKRWKNIRDTYSRRKRGNIRKRHKDGETFRKKRLTAEWHLASAVSFLDNVDTEKTSVSNFQYADCNSFGSDQDASQHSEVDVKFDVTTYEHDLKFSIAPTGEDELVNQTNSHEQSRKRKANFGIQHKLDKPHKLDTMAQARVDDPIDLFFQSIAGTVKKLPPATQIRIKMEVCRIVTELELQELQSAPSCKSIYSSDSDTT